MVGAGRVRRWWILLTLRGYRASRLVAVVLPSKKATARLADLSVVDHLLASVEDALAGLEGRA
jgi:hypothetical protein